MFIVDALKSAVLGIAEGITEWLPISSTGHMILVNEFMNTNDGFLASQLYLYVIQLGAILAIATLYFGRLNPFASYKSREEKSNTWYMWLKVIIACIPAAIIGLLFNDYMESFSTPAVVSAMLIIYGVAFILAENGKKSPKINNMNDMSWKTALYIGLFQILSIVPGTSRSGATILGAILLGVSRSVAAEFSFFLAIPVMFGVSFLKIGSYLKDVYIDNVMLPLPSSDWILLAIGMVVAYIVSMLAVKFLTRYVESHDFKVFGWYRIALGIIVLLIFALI